MRNAPTAASILLSSPFSCYTRFAVEDQFSLESAWKIQIAEQRVTRVIAALARIAVDLAIESVVGVSIASVVPSGIEAIEHRSPPREDGPPLSEPSIKRRSSGRN